jgi:trehalose synthase
VVASDVGGIRDQIADGETGLLVQPDDLDGFADRVCALFGDPALAVRLGDAARENVRHAFLGPRHLSQYVELFGALLGARVAA